MNLTVRQKEIITGLVAPGLAIMGFGLGEVALRAVNVAKYGTTETVEKTSVFKIEQDTGLQLPVPNARLGVVRFNAQGFRGPDLAPTPPPNTLRIAFLGSSTTFDGGIPEAQTWPAQSSQQIAAALPDGCTVEYLNAGLPGFGTPHTSSYFDLGVRQMAPHVVVVLPGDVTNDNTNMLREKGYEKNDIIAPSWLAKQSILWGKIEKNLKIIALQRAARRGIHFVDFDEEHYSAIFADRLRALVEKIQMTRALPVLVTITGRFRISQSPEERLDAAQSMLLYNPFTSVDDLIAGRDAYNEKISRVAASTNSLLVEDPYVVPADDRHFRDSSHFTAAGSAIQGRRVATSMLRSDAFAQVVRTLGAACSRFTSIAY